jgi:hypothetical protein
MEKIPQETDIKPHKAARGCASQFFVAGELCRRGYYAVVTLGNTPNTDILCSNSEGTKFVHIQVKTFSPNKLKGAACPVGIKAEKYSGENFFWVISGIPEKNSAEDFEYYIIPSKIMSKNVSKQHKEWSEKQIIKKGHCNEENKFRTVCIPPKTHETSWDISNFRDKWELIEEKLK